MGTLMLVVVVATSIWVLLDAQKLGVRKGVIAGIGNMGPWGWFWSCLLLWFVAFPMYLVKRPEFKRAI